MDEDGRSDGEAAADELSEEPWASTESDDPDVNLTSIKNLAKVSKSVSFKTNPRLR